MKRLFFVVLSVLAMLLPAFCVNALAGQVDISFHVTPAGDTVHPGEKTALTLMIENSAAVSDFPLSGDSSSLLRLITTAKNLRVELDDSSAPFRVESSNPVIIGNLPSGVVVKAVFRINVSDDAETGVYSVPVRFKYSKTSYYIHNNTFILSDEDEVVVRYVKISVEKRDYDVSLRAIEDNLISGKEGIVKLQIQNTGKNVMKNCLALINVTPPFKPNPSAMMVYIGDLSSGEIRNVTFKIYVMEGALNHSYPATVVLRFETEAGMPVSLVKTIGLDVNAEDSIALIKADSFIPEYKRIPADFGVQGVRGYVRVTVRNLGEDMDDVSANLRFETPLIRPENSPYLGKFRKGEERSLIFYVISSAPAGKYRGELFLKYRNVFGDDEIIKGMPVEIEVSEGSALGISGVNPLRLGIGSIQSIEVGVVNTLNTSLKKIKLSLISSDKTVVPVSPSSYIDRLDAGERRNVTFRLSISDQASEGMHLFYLIEQYSVDGVSDLMSVEEFSAGIKSGREEFKVVSVSSNLIPDKTGDVTVVFRNSGNRTIQDAVLELDLSPPLYPAGSSSLLGITGKPQPSLYYVGTLKAGEEAKATFKVDVDKDAGAGSYPATVRVRYYDAGGYLHVSGPVTVSIEVKERQIFTTVTVTALVMVSVAFIASAIFVRRKKRES